MDKLEDKQRCPEAILTVFYPLTRCNLNDKVCLLEGENECPYYDDWLFEQRQKRLDKG